MSTSIRPSRSVIFWICLNMPLLAGPGEPGPEFGGSLTLQRPLGEYQSTVLDAGLGYGLGARIRIPFSPRQALHLRIGYDWFPEGAEEAQGQNYYMHASFQIRELSLGLIYEWSYSGGASGGYLMGGPVYRRWQDRRTQVYDQTRPGPIPASQVISTTPSGLGLDLGWGYRGTTKSAIETHLVTSKYGSTGMAANTLQFSFIQYW